MLGQWVLNFIDLLFNVLIFAIVARALLSWFVNPASAHGAMWRVMVILEEITEPVIAPIRRVMPRLGMLDLSPLVAIIALQVIQSLLVGAVRGSL